MDEYRRGVLGGHFVVVGVGVLRGRSRVATICVGVGLRVYSVGAVRGGASTYQIFRAIRTSRGYAFAKTE